jgi:hypothetical protein
MTTTAGYRQYLKAAVAASAAPYGYTLTVWTTGAVTAHAQGQLPSALDAILLLVGATTAFGALGSGAYGSVFGALAPEPTRLVRVWGGMHLPSVGAAVLLCSLLALVVPPPLVWLLVGATATSTYLLVLALQFRLAASHRWSTRHPRDRDPDTDDGGG